jgi:capsular exopolysaccharide synthesis family protein
MVTAVTTGDLIERSGALLNDNDADAGSPLAEHFGYAFHAKMVVSRETPPVSVEQYRRLAATLHHAQSERGIKVVMVASALAGEGKTLTAANLALTLSESYRRRVLIIDADLRRPTLHEVFEAPYISGLSDGLAGDVDRRMSILQISSHLALLPAGRPSRDPMSALTSDRMRRLLAEAREKFDWVILDTPPVGLLTDANLLSAMVDGAVFVISAGRTPFALLQKSVEAIGRDRVLGVVLNRAAQAAVPGGYYTDYYGQNHGEAPHTPPAGT